MESRQIAPRRAAAKALPGRRPGFVDADTALAFLRYMVEKGLSYRLHRMDERKVWAPEGTETGTSGEAEKHDE